jgi:hypothetical protein
MGACARLASSLYVLVALCGGCVGGSEFIGGPGRGGASGATGAGGTTADAGSGAGGTTGAGGAGGGAGSDGGASDAGSPDVPAATDGGRDGGGGNDGGTGTGGAAGIGGPSLCAAGRYVICESFESTAVGAVPAGWTQRGNAVVADDQAARGTHALKIGRADSGERRIFTSATALGSGHWGRVFYRVQLPVPAVFVHSTLVALQGVGPVNGNEEVRVVDTVKQASGTHQFLYNVQPSGNEFGKGSPYNWRFDDMWHCAEWHIDNPTQSFHFYIDGAEVTQIAIDNGAGNYAGSDIPPVFSVVRVGWNNYQAAPAGTGFVAWLDEIALDKNRIGCGQ